MSLISLLQSTKIRIAAFVAQRIEHKIADLEVGGSIPLERATSNVAVSFDATQEGSHSGQLHEFRKLERAISTQVRILHPPQLFNLKS